MGNSSTRDARPIDTIFKLPSPLPSWPPGEGFGSGKIDLGGLEVCQITTFKKLWSTSKGGPNNGGVTFFEPSPIPDGFSMLGCYSQSNDTPLFGWVLAGKDADGSGTLADPVDYIQVWTDAEKSCYIWLPMPPDGYRSVGCAVTTSPEKPPLDKIRCVRADLTEECETDQLLWGTKRFNVFSSRPKTRGRQAQGVGVGSFAFTLESDADVDASAGTSNSTPALLSCLKNNNFATFSSMPNLAQIEALIQEYSPRFYFHPSETFLPASTTWYFTNGVLLYHTGDESSPVAVKPDGSNLPQDGPNDGTYWLDLPLGEGDKEKVKKGDLQSAEAYLHIKPMLGATFTDIAVWVFYPFNGPSTAKLGLVDLPLSRTGGHIGDWEHVTLRISNFDGVLRRVYFAQHSGGMWVVTPLLEFENGSNRFAAYSSLNGHATYPFAGLVVQGTDAVGIRNDTAKSNMFLDVGAKYSIMAAEYIGDVVELPWVNYTRKWGPKITYRTGELQNSLTSSTIRRLVNILPNEFYREDGPTGPKMKVDWDGDER